MQWFGRSRLGLLGPSYAVMGDGTCGEAIMRRWREFQLLLPLFCSGSIKSKIILATITISNAAWDYTRSISPPLFQKQHTKAIPLLTIFPSSK